MKEIKHRYTGTVIYRSEGAETLREAVEEAVKRKVSLQEADLRGASLAGADLGGAYLQEAYLRGAYLREADLTDTVLDPARAPNQRGDFHEVDGECVGYRTRKSKHVGDTVYQDGETYRAAVFSCCPVTACHPGLYCYSTTDEVRRNYPGVEMIEVRFKRVDLHAAGGKHRVRAFRVVGAIAKAERTDA